MWTAPLSTGRPTAALIEVMMRDLRREAPGRKRKSASTRNNASTTRPRVEEKSFNAPSRSFRGASSDHLQSPLPACLVEEVNHDLEHELGPVAPRCLPVLIVRRLERPVDEHGTPDDVLLRNEAPVPAV